MTSSRRLVCDCAGALTGLERAFIPLRSTVRGNNKESTSFLKKRRKKLLLIDKSFLVLFFKKELLTFLS
jgi:hypothetical protein